MSEVYFVRHGQASFSSENYDQLSELGHQQAQLLGEHFATQRMAFDRVIVGGMKRHQQTLDNIKQGLKAKNAQLLPKAKVYSKWNEFDFKQLIKAFMQQFPVHQLNGQAKPTDYFKLLKLSLESWAAGELSHNMPEQWHEFEQRIIDMLNELKNVNTKKRVLVVSSGGTIAMALSIILQAPAQTMVRLNFQTRNTALSSCYFNASGFQLSQFNALPHLNSLERKQHITYF